MDKAIIDAFKEIAHWDDIKKAWVYSKDRMGGSNNVVKHAGDTIEGRIAQGYRSININKTRYRLHRLAYCVYNDTILGDHEMIDHINHDIVDNSKDNLRVANNTQNGQNRTKLVGCSSSYKGVCWDRYHSIWSAKIRVDKKLKHLGYFSNDQEAALAYNKAAIKHFGVFANLNVI